MEGGREAARRQAAQGVASEERENNVFTEHYQTQKQVNAERQNIHKYLKTYEPLIVIVNDALTNCHSIIMNEFIDIRRKVQFVTMLRTLFEFLRLFVLDNLENKLIMNRYTNTCFKYMKLDFGQVALICEILRNNEALLNPIDRRLVYKFAHLIQQEGRQCVFLDFFDVIQKCNGQVRAASSLLGFFAASSLLLLRFFFSASSSLLLLGFSAAPSAWLTRRSRPPPVPVREPAPGAEPVPAEAEL